MRARRLIVLLWLYIQNGAGAMHEVEEHNALFRRGMALLEPYLILSGAGPKPADPTTEAARSQIAEGIRLLNRVVEMNPKNWAALWLIGKGHQALQDHVAAYGALHGAFEINSTHSDVARELMLECICIGRTSQAVDVADVAAKHRPDDPGLRANLGLALLSNGELDRARKVTQEAISLAPHDPITRRILNEIEAVANGSPIDLKKYCRL